ESNFNLSLGGFVKSTSVCTTVCGDGFKTPDEQCDDGDAGPEPNNGPAYGQCQDGSVSGRPACTLGGRCGDNVIEGDEECDNGTNLSGYGDTSPNACATNCYLPGRCGDGDLDPQEECDDGDGNNTG